MDDVTGRRFCQRTDFGLDLMDAKIEERLRHLLLGGVATDATTVRGPLELSSDRFVMTISCAWRIWSGHRMVLGSGDEEPDPNAAQEHIVGRRIVSVATIPKSSEINLSFEDDVLLETFQDSSQYESWQIAVADGELIGAGPAGNSWAFGPSAAPPDRLRE